MNSYPEANIRNTSNNQSKLFVELKCLIKNIKTRNIKMQQPRSALLKVSLIFHNLNILVENYITTRQFDVSYD